MWQLNQQWEANRQKLETLEQQQKDGMKISDTRLNEARLQVARDNEHAQVLANAQADREAAAQAEQQRVEEHRNAIAQREADDFKARARTAWTGDDASFEAAFPRLLESHRIEQAQQRLSGQTAYAAGRVRL